MEVVLNNSIFSLQKPPYSKELNMKCGYTSIIILLFSTVFLSFPAHSNGESHAHWDPLTKLIRAPTSKPTSDSLGNRELRPLYVGKQKGLKEANRILTLPGQPPANFSQYSGHVTVDPAAGRALFYYFAESENPTNKPLVLWLNGGPGCSSFGAGAMRQLGPFRVNSDGETLWHNKNSWNNVANVIFLESPAGVGFSYSNTSSDYATGDERTAADSYTFLVNWFERFPEYKSRDFFVTGESYAGHYVPQLAALILKNNKINSKNAINLKGIAIGNAYIDGEDLLRGIFDYYWTRALISDETHRGIVEKCNFSTEATVSKECIDYENEADEAVSSIYPDDIYAPFCTSPPSTSPSPSAFDPCTRSYIRVYLNRADVQKALHANVTGNVQGPWDACSSRVDYNTREMQESVLPTIKELMASGIRVWIYSGDTDSVVPITSTKYSLTKIGAPIKTPWRPWYSRGEVGGYVVEYQNITFVTVRGSGHYVPSYQPERALTLISSFLEGKLPPKQR